MGLGMCAVDLPQRWVTGIHVCYHYNKFYAYSVMSHVTRLLHVFAHKIAIIL